MQTTWQQSHWLDTNPIQRQVIAFMVSVIIVVLILLIPISLKSNFNSQEKTIEVLLSKDIKPIETKQKPINQPSEIKQDVKPKSEKEIIEKPPIEPIVQKVPEPIKPIKKIDDTKPIQKIPEINEAPVNNFGDEKAENLPSSAVIFNSAYGKVHLYELDDDFKASTGHEDDFKFREINQPEWNVVTKLIDEEVDKPRIYMNFYSEGIVGSTERFFDKISYKKVFTTRYGTKIACGGIGPLVMCSWK